MKGQQLLTTNPKSKLLDDSSEKPAPGPEDSRPVFNNTSIPKIVDNISVRMSGDSENTLHAQANRKHNEDHTAVVPARKPSLTNKEIQVNSLPYRLRVLPVIVGGSAGQRRWPLMLLRIVFSQIGLALLLVSWTMCCATAFYYSEAPHEEFVIENFKKNENDLAIDLSTQLRQIGSEDQRSSSYPIIIHKQLQRHTLNLIKAVEEGYVGLEAGRIWNFSGCVLFAVSLLTTLGFGVPVPHTNWGRAAAVIFATIGVPLHFLLMYNIAQTFLSKVHKGYFNDNDRTYLKDSLKTQEDPIGLETAGTKIISVDTIGNKETSQLKTKKVFFTLNCASVLLLACLYYILGILIFGIARGKSIQDAVLFSLEFINNGSLAQVGELMRLLYAAYLEGLVLHAALFFAVLQRSAVGSYENLAYRYDLLTNGR